MGLKKAEALLTAPNEIPLGGFFVQKLDCSSIKEWGSFWRSEPHRKRFLGKRATRGWSRMWGRRGGGQI